MLDLAERAVLYTYANRFGELPPLNSALPRKWGNAPGAEFIKWAKKGIVVEVGNIARFPQIGDYSSYCQCVESERLSNTKKG